MSDVPEASRSPTNAELLRAVLKCWELGIHTSLPCRVEKVYTNPPAVDVKPLIRRRFQNPDGTELDESIAKIPRVKLAFLRAGPFKITLPVRRGDIVEVMFSEASRDVFEAGGGEEVDPDDFRRFDLSDAWAWPGAGYPDKLALKDWDPDDLVIGVDNDGAVIHIKESGEIALGSKDPADNLALASLVKAEIDALRSTVNTHISTTYAAHTHLHAPGPGAPVATAPPLPAGTPPAAVGDVKSDVVLSD